MGVRDYDPKLGQFLTPDPLYFADLDKCRASPLQCSLYGYAAGNPVSFIDPSGLGVTSFLRNLAADVVEIGVTVAGAAVGAAVGTFGGAWTGPGAIVTGSTGAVVGAGVFRGLASPTVDRIRGVKPSKENVKEAVMDGMTSEMGGQVLSEYVITPLARAAKARWARSAAAKTTADATANATKPTASVASDAQNLELLNRSLASEAQVCELASGEGKVMAGNGGRVILRDEPRLIDIYGGQEGDWQKVGSSHYSSSGGASFETHAYRNSKTGEVVEYKTKINDLDANASSANADNASTSK
jgi:hypothetical protein